MVTLDLDASTAKLSAKLTQTRGDLQGVADGYDDIQAASKEALTGATTSQDKLNKSVTGADAAFKSQGSTIQRLTDHLKRLGISQKKTTDPKLIKKYNTEISKTTKAIDLLRRTGPGAFNAINAGGRASIGVFSRLRGVLSTTFGPLIAVGAAAAGIQALISSVNDFEQEAAELSSITGATGVNLEFLKQQAVEVGTETTISAQATVEAYKLIASAKPELLKDVEALASFTREAIALTEAIGSKGDLPTAATNLTDIMNKLQLPADQASRVVNALAAGSKEGSANIDDLAASFLQSGTTLAAQNVSLEEGVGLYEALAEQGKKGAEAGTAVRNVAAKLAATDILPKDAVKRLTDAGVNMELLSDKSLSFSDRLRALAPIQNDANALVSVFGLENLEASQILLGATDRVDELTEAVTGTTVAYEQAAINTGTAAAEITKFKNTVTALIQGNGGGLSRLVGLVVAFARQGVLFLGEVLRQVGPIVTSVVTNIGELLTSIRGLLPATQDATGGVSTFGRVAQIVTVPLKLLVGGIGLLVRVATAVVDRFKAVRESGGLTGRIFSFIGRAVASLISGFVDLPPVIVGSFNAIGAFVRGVSSSIFDLGSKVATVLSEAFNIRKLITQGTGGLKEALGNLLVNPFEGVGERVRNAFNDGFTATKEILKVPVKTELTPDSEVIPVAATPDVATPAATPSTLKADAAAKKQAEEAAKKAQELAAARVSALKDGQEKELALEDLRFKDLKTKLEKFNLDTTQAAIQHEENKLGIKTKFLAQAADLDNLDGKERIKFIFDQTSAEINALEAALSAVNGGSVSEEQTKQLALLRKNATAQYLTDLNALQSEERQKATEHEIALLELKRDGFDSQKDFETFKAKEVLGIRLRSAEEQLKIIQALEGAESTAALNLQKTINEIKGSLAELNEIPDTEFSLYSLFGLDPDDPGSAKIIEGIEAAAGALVGALSEINARQLESAEVAVKEADTKIAATQKLIDAAENELTKQEERGAKGFANNADLVRKDIALLKAQQAAEQEERTKALNQKKKIQKEQAILDTLTQGSSLLSASAQIFNSVAAIPFVGPIIGAGLVALMLGSFAAAKVRVFQNINNQKAKKGYVGEVKGKRHSGGGERAIDHLEVEDGEAFGILSRQATKKHQGDFIDFTNAANKGDRLGMAEVAMRMGGVKLNTGTAETLVENVNTLGDLKADITVQQMGPSADKVMHKLMKELTAEVRKQGDGITYTNDAKIVKRGNTTIKVKL